MMIMMVKIKIMGMIWYDIDNIDENKTEIRPMVW